MGIDRAAWEEEFESFLDGIRPFDGATELLSDVKERGFTLVLASSGKRDHVEHFLDLLSARDLADLWTSSDDVEVSKPEPDLVAAALSRSGGSSAVMVGDSVYDVQAASRLSIPTLGVRTGGFSVGELLEAGMLQVFDSLVAFRSALEGTPLSRPVR